VDAILPDPRIAKVILTRNPLDSYVSRKIAAATGQWRLTDMKHAKSARIRFDMAEFRKLMDALGGFQARLRRGLQQTGQTAFHVRYEDINDVDVINGLARFLGSTATLERPPGKLKKQNPTDLAAKVENYDEMVASLQHLDPFGLDQSVVLEPERQAQVPGFVAHPEAGLLFLPVKGAPVTPVLDWMGQVGGVGRDGLITKMTQKDLRQWIKDHPGYRSFSVVSHPLVRAHRVFCRFVLAVDRPAYADPRKTLRQRYKLPIPGKAPGDDWTADQHKAAFAGFLAFLKGNLAGQTSIRVDQAWASQTAVLQGVSSVTLPDRILREEALEQGLNDLAREVGLSSVPAPHPEAEPGPIPLKGIYDGKIEQAALDVYRRDYHTFGYPRLNRL